MLEVVNISKSFNGFLAVADISFSLEKGSVLGFLGPNGAGKSTTMKMITGFLQPTKGDILVCGNSILKNKLEAQKQIGYVPENAPLYEELYVKEFLKYIANLREIDKSKIEHSISYVAQLCSLEEVLFQKIETLSKGYKRRVSLAQALIHDPKILILDEPTDGLDPNQKHDVRKLIKDLAIEKSILISTHILEEVEEVCNNCIIIGSGKKLFSGTPLELKEKSSTHNLKDVFRAITLQEEVEGVTL